MSKAGGQKLGVSFGVAIRFSGQLVKEVVPDGQAAAARVKPGDFVVSAPHKQPSTPK